MPFIPLFQSPKSFYRLAVASFFFLQGLVFASWASRIPDIKQALALNEAQLGGVLFAIPVGQMSAMALSGYLVSRFGSHRMLLLAALLYSGTLMALGFISETWHLFAMLVFFGVAANLHNISVNTQAVGVERLYRRSIMAAFHGLWSLAGFVGGIVGALFAAFSVSTRVHFSFIFAVCMGIVAIMFRLTLPRDRARDTAPGHKRPKGKIDPYVVLLGLIAFGCMASEGTLYDWSAVYYEAIIKPSPELIRLGYIAYMCTMVCGRFMADGLVTRFGVIRILQASGALIAAGLLISVLLPHGPRRRSASRWWASARLRWCRSATAWPGNPRSCIRAWRWPWFQPSGSSASCSARRSSASSPTRRACAIPLPSLPCSGS
ncbi:MAG: MFS transporter [Bilophila wadsworthia]